MIELRVVGENARDFAEQLAAAVGALAGVAPGAAAAPDPKSTSRGKTKPASADTATAPSGSTANPTSGDATASKTEGGSPEAVTKESVAAKATAYGQPGKGGPAALKELFVKHGSANGKWSEITEDKYPALNAELDELLT